MGGAMTKKAKEQVTLCRQTGGTELNLSDCDIRKLGSFKSIVKLKLLVRLNISRNYLQCMPPTVKKLVNLEELNISYNRFSTLPWELYQLGNLRVLMAEGNDIVALPSPSITRLTKLEVLDLGGNRLEELPQDFSGMRSLTSLSLARNSLVQVFPDVFKVKSIKQLNLSGNVSLVVPENLSDLPLEVLDLSECNLKSITPTLGRCISLTSLRLDKNQLDALPSELANLVNLKTLRISQNNLTQIDNLNFGNFTALEELCASENQLDHMPRGFGHCKSLRIFDVSHNQLTAINREVGWLHATLRKLLVSNNRIKTVPGELSFLNPAIEVDLSNNPLASPFIQWYMLGIVTLMENLQPFLRAYPPHCVAHGDALQGTTVATPTTFSIQASDYHGKPRLNGGDEFEVVLKGLDKNDQPIEQKAVVKDNQDGNYTVFFNPMVAGQFELHITESGEPISGSPMPYTVLPGPVDLNECTVTGIPQGNVEVGQSVQISICAYDRFRNPSPPNLPFMVTLITPAGQSTKLVCQNVTPSLAKCSFIPVVPGRFVLQIKYAKTTLPYSPYFIIAL